VRLGEPNDEAVVFSDLLGLEILIQLQVQANLKTQAVQL
jgi:hypothetical protein